MMTFMDVVMKYSTTHSVFFLLGEIQSFSHFLFRKRKRRLASGERYERTILGTERERERV